MREARAVVVSADGPAQLKAQVLLCHTPSVRVFSPRLLDAALVVEENGLQEASLAKRLRGTPERIELENYRVSLQQEVLEEVPEETLAEHNLSSVLERPAGEEAGSRWVQCVAGCVGGLRVWQGRGVRVWFKGMVAACFKGVGGVLHGCGVTEVV